MFDQLTSSSSDDEELVYIFHTRRAIKNESYIEETVSRYSPEEFMEHFRVTRQLAQEISERFKNSQYYSYQSGEFGKISSYQYTLIFLWFAGREAASYRDVGDRFGIAKSSLRKIILRMIYFLSNLSGEVITWPTPREQMIIKQEFSVNGFPNVVGAIDGSHVRLDKPMVDPDSYLNRKSFYSMQVVCDSRPKISDIVIGFPGSVHDSRVFQASPLSETLEEKCGNNYILGDSGYPCRRHLLTPYKDLGNLTRAQTNFNIKLSKTRYIVEHCFGVLKQKFRQLYHLKLRDDNDITNFIRACCVLHNLALDDAFPLEEVPYDEVPPNEDIMQEHNYNIPPVEYRDDRDGITMRNHVANMLIDN